jgi:monothiol glutaredoxin
VRSASDSHDDFKPRKTPDLSDCAAVQALIAEHVKAHSVLLYMKGTPSAPQCGFSQQVVRILHATGCEFSSINVLEHPEIREGIKAYS